MYGIPFSRSVGRWGFSCLRAASLRLWIQWLLVRIMTAMRREWCPQQCPWLLSWICWEVNAQSTWVFFLAAFFGWLSCIFGGPQPIHSECILPQILEKLVHLYSEIGNTGRLWNKARDAADAIQWVQGGSHQGSWLCTTAAPKARKQLLVYSFNSWLMLVASNMVGIQLLLLDDGHPKSPEFCGVESPASCRSSQADPAAKVSARVAVLPRWVGIKKSTPTSRNSRWAPSRVAGRAHIERSHVSGVCRCTFHHFSLDAIRWYQMHFHFFSSSHFCWKMWGLTRRFATPPSIWLASLRNLAVRDSKSFTVSHRANQFSWSAM